jgi:mercuric ion transport protein
VDSGFPSHTSISNQSRNIGFSALSAILVAAIPKCPLCWIALMSALGVGSAINSNWLQPLVVALLFLPVTVLLAGARRRRGYGPFFLGLVAAIAMYLCKFRLNYDVGVYLSGATLLGASVWNIVPKHQAADNIQCHCRTQPRH